jgi:hypothetical protein
VRRTGHTCKFDNLQFILLNDMNKITILYTFFMVQLCTHKNAIEKQSYKQFAILT